MITRHRFGLESPNLHQTCILEYSRLVLKMEVIDLDLQVHLGHFDLKFLEIWLVCMITCNGFELESPNLHQICILGFSLLLLKMEVIDLDLQCHLTIIPIQELLSTLVLYTELGWPRGATRPKKVIPLYNYDNKQFGNCYPISLLSSI